MMTGLLAGTATTAMAQQVAVGHAQQQETIRQVVDFADLDLHRPAGIASLHARLRIAAQQVCPGQDFRTQRPTREQCRLAALEGAVATLPQEVQAYHAQWVAQGSKWLAAPRTTTPTRVASRR